ncbi:MAG: hypothetical protein GY756_06445 [bacterium]|nr:hypothetical protein [bacterium]
MSNYYLKDSKFNLHRPKQKRWIGRLVSLNKFFKNSTNVSNKVYKRHIFVITIATVIVIIGVFYVLF